MVEARDTQILEAPGYVPYEVPGDEPVKGAKQVAGIVRCGGSSIAINKGEESSVIWRGVERMGSVIETNIEESVLLECSSCVS